MAAIETASRNDFLEAVFFCSNSAYKPNTNRESVDDAIGQAGGDRDGSRTTGDNCKRLGMDRKAA